MPRRKMWVNYEDGTHLSESQKRPGEFSPLTRDDATNKKLGHVTLSPDDEDEDEPVWVFPNLTEEEKAAIRAEQRERDERLEALAKLAAAGAVIAAKKAAPALKSAWSKVVRRRGVDSTSTELVPETVMLSRRQIAENIKSIIEAHPSLLGKDKSNEWIQALGGDRITGGRH